MTNWNQDVNTPAPIQIDLRLADLPTAEWTPTPAPEPTGDEHEKPGRGFKLFMALLAAGAGLAGVVWLYTLWGVR